MENNDKKKVLIVAHHLTVGGVQKSLISALKAIDYEKYDVTLYLRKNRLDLLPLVDERVKVIVNDDSAHYYRKPKALLLQMNIFLCKLLKVKKRVWELEKELADWIRSSMMDYEKKRFFDEENYDVAISYVQGYTTYFVANYVMADKKIAFYQVSTDELHDVHEEAFPKYDIIVVEHEDIKSLMEIWYPFIKGKIEIVENYVDSEILIAQSREKSISRESMKTVICSCGRFAKVKGFDMAVEAAKILKNRGIDFVWYIVGDGPERQKIEKLIEDYNLWNYIKLPGMQTNPYPYIASSDIYVQPSYEEALSIALLEAQMLCRPIITTKTVGGSSMIRDGVDGKVVDIDKNALAQGIEELIHNSEYRNKFIKELEQKDYCKLRKQYQKQWDNILQN